MTFTERLYTNLGNRIDIAVPAWRDDAACRDADPSLFFPDHGQSYSDILPQALTYCNRCPVKSDCLAAADHSGVWGIWGGREFGTKNYPQRFELVGETVECQMCGAEVTNRKGGRMRKWCSAECRYEADKERRTA